MRLGRFARLLMEAYTGALLQSHTEIYVTRPALDNLSTLITLRRNIVPYETRKKYVDHYAVEGEVWGSVGTLLQL